MSADCWAILPIQACGCCDFWRRSKRQPYPSEAKLHPVFEGRGTPWVEGWCGMLNKETAESTCCPRWKDRTP